MSSLDREPEYFALRADAQGEQFIRASDEVLVVALDAHNAVLLALEPSPAFGEEVVILPGGQAEDGESLDETANRELQEELGFRAQRLEYLGEICPWSKYLSVRSHIFLGRDLEPSPLPGDEKTPVGLLRVPWHDLDTLISSRRLRDARALAGLFLARRLLGSAHEEGAN